MRHFLLLTSAPSALARRVFQRPAGSFVGRVERRANGIRADESARSLPRSNGCHGRRARRCLPTSHNACSYTADSSFRLPP